MRRDILIAVGASAASAVISGALAYLIAKRRFERILDDEVQAVKEHYAKKAGEKVFKKEKTMSLDDLAKAAGEYRAKLEREEYAEKVEEMGYFEPTSDLPDVVDVHGNVMDVSDEEKDFILRGEHYRMMSKGEKKPYIIAYEEYHEDFDHHEKDTLTYYAGDDTLADSMDEIVDDSDYKIGENGLDFFGWRSYDENVVYVRNENIGVDFEVLHDPGRYSHVVLGMEIDPDDSPRVKTKPRKMREED